MEGIIFVDCDCFIVEYLNGIMCKYSFRLL